MTHGQNHAAQPFFPASFNRSESAGNWKFTSSTVLKASTQSVAPFPPVLINGEILSVPVPATRGHGGGSPKLFLDRLLVGHFY